MSTLDLLTRINRPSGSGDLMVDIHINQAQFGLYTVNLYDQAGKNPVTLGSGNNIDNLPDSFPIPASFATPPSALAGRLIGWTLTLATPAEPDGELYFAKVTVREGFVSLTQKPVEYSGALDGAKILIGFGVFL